MTYDPVFNPLPPISTFPPPPVLPSLRSHKDSVSFTGGGAGEDLRHARPHHARERHQGPHHAVRPGRPRAGGHHRLGQTYPRYRGSTADEWMTECCLGSGLRILLI